MQTRLPISVFIIARNEADRIARPIRSVRDWVDEVLVVDSGSTDETVAIALALGARVLAHPWAGYGPQKVFAEAQCRNDWLLNLDADEELSPRLAQSIRAEFAGGSPECAAFELCWRLVHWRDERPRLLAPARRFIRLYHRCCAGFQNSIVHDSVRVSFGNVRPLRGCVWHRSFRSLAHFHAKLSEYAELQARDLVARRRRPGLLRVVLEPPLAFLRMLLLRRSLIYGWDGLRMATSYASTRRYRLALARRLPEQPPLQGRRY